jgi:hypothetical protein
LFAPAAGTLKSLISSTLFGRPRALLSQYWTEPEFEFEPYCEESICQSKPILKSWLPAAAGT